MSKLCYAKAGELSQTHDVFTSVAKIIPVLATIQVNSILEIVKMIIGQEEISFQCTKESQRMSSCGAVVEADEPM